LTDGFFIGCITGTSVDGLDIALIKIKNDHIDILAAQTHSLPDDLRTDLIELGQADTVSLEHLGRCDALLGSFIGEAVAKFMAQNKIQRDKIEAIGSHGQTVRHRPDNSPAFTMQIGDPSRISEQTGITTVADFRRRDVAAGGQGAPLVPPFHRALFAGDLPVILNIGGISNVSILNDDLLGFDTGPGNCLMDSWYEVHQQAQFDTDGKWAASGEILPDLLTSLLTDPYFSRQPPKSTGREYFNLPWLRPHLKSNYNPQDVQATLAELTAVCTLQALTQISVIPSEIIVVGGGRLNSHLMNRLQAITSCDVQPSENSGYDGDAIEAAAFAWLAARCINQQPGNHPSVTGAKGPRILGAVYPA
jgi:anhydro-N-acetylmuramic acid kinase